MPSSISKHRQAAFKRQNGRCFYCGLPMWLKQPAEFTAKYKMSEGAASRFQCTAEHLKARQDGGTNSDGNIVAACRHCNMTRHRISPPPTPATYQKHVKRRIRAGRWHPRNVHHMKGSVHVV
jgi:5-methylcytosine-specific restriction endonuclease McrA